MVLKLPHCSCVIVSVSDARGFKVLSQHLRLFAGTVPAHLRPMSDCESSFVKVQALQSWGEACQSTGARMEYHFRLLRIPVVCKLHSSFRNRGRI